MHHIFTLRKRPQFDLPRSFGESMGDLFNGSNAQEFSLLNVKRTDYYFPFFVRLSLVENISMIRTDYHECMFVDNLFPTDLKLKPQLNLNEQEELFISHLREYLNKSSEDPFFILNNQTQDFVKILSQPDIWERLNTNSFFEITQLISQQQDIDSFSFSQLENLLQRENIENREFITQHILHYAFQENYTHIDSVLKSPFFAQLFQNNTEVFLHPALFAGQKEFVGRLIKSGALSPEKMNSSLSYLQNTMAYCIPEFKTTLDMFNFQINIPSLPEQSPKIHNIKKKKI